MAGPRGARVPDAIPGFPAEGEGLQPARRGPRGRALQVPLPAPHSPPPPPTPRPRPRPSLRGAPDSDACPRSAGVGRTGCFIVIDAMLERIKPEKTVDVYGHVTLMRSQRNYMVQTEDQYSFIHEALLEAVGCGNTEVPARSLYAYIQKLAQVEPGEHVTGMELEFKVGRRPRPGAAGAPRSGSGLPLALRLGRRTAPPGPGGGPEAAPPVTPGLPVSAAAGQLQSPHIPLHQCQSAL